MADLIARAMNKKTSEQLAETATNIGDVGSFRDWQVSIIEKMKGEFTERGYNVTWNALLALDGDWTTAIQTAANGFSNFFIPDGNYKITEPILFNNKKIRISAGNNVNLIFSKAQTTPHVGPDDYTACLLFINTFDVYVEHLNIEYDGLGSAYEFPINSYDGNYSGIMFKNDTALSNYTLNNVSCKYFNIIGVKFYSPVNLYEIRYKNVKVFDCDFSYNRSSGIQHEGVDNFLMAFCECNNNGKVDDFGTGYGISSGVGTISKNVTIENSIFKDNIRKGVDFHGKSENTTISDSKILGQTLWGIYYENDIGTTEIENNLIDITVPATYTLAFGNAFMLGSYVNNTASNTINNVKVTNNTVKYTSLNGQTFRIISLCNFAKDSIFDIKHNSFDINANASFIGQTNDGVANNKNYKLYYEDNHVVLNGKPYKNYINNLSDFEFHNNTFEVTHVDVTDITAGFFVSAIIDLHFTNNTFISVGNFAYFSNLTSTNVRDINNRFNGLPQPTERSFINVIAMGSFAVTAGVLTVKSSFNVTSITRIGPGEYDITLTNAVKGDIQKYPLSINTGLNTANGFSANMGRLTSTSLIKILVYNPSGLALIDSSTCQFVVYG